MGAIAIVDPCLQFIAPVHQGAVARAEFDDQVGQPPPEAFGGNLQAGQELGFDEFGETRVDGEIGSGGHRGS